MAQNLSFEELSERKAPDGQLADALQKMTAALQGMGDAGSEARKVLEQLRKSLRSTAAQGAKAARTLAKFDEIERLAAPEAEKEKGGASAGKGGGKGGKGGAQAAREEAAQQVSVWQALLQTLRALWAQFWEYLQTYYAPAIAAWQEAWAQMRAAAAAVWGPLRAAALQLWQGALAPLARYLATEFWPGVVNSFSLAFAPIAGGAVSAAVTVLGQTFRWLCGIVTEAVQTVIRPALALLLTVWQDLMAGIQTAWAAYGQPLLDGVVLAFQNLTALLSALWHNVAQPILQQAIAALGALWADCLNPLWQQLTLALGAVGDLVLTLWNTVLAPLGVWLAGTFGPVFTQVFAAAASAVSAAVSVISGAVTAVLAVLRGLADFVSGALRGAWDDAWNALAATVQTVWQTITATVQNAVNGLVGVVQNMAGAIGSAVQGILSLIAGAGGAASGAVASAGQWLAGRSAAPALAYAQRIGVPALAQGAVIPPNREFLAVLGDQRHGTNVEAPLATIRQAVADVMGEARGGQTAGFEAVVAALRDILDAIYGIEIDGDKLARTVRRAEHKRAIMRGGY